MAIDVIPLACESEQQAFLLAEPVEAASRLSVEITSRPERRVYDHAGRLEPAQVPGDQWLGKVDVVDQLGDGHRAVGEALEDAQAGRIGEGLVEDGHLAQLLWGCGDGGDRRTDVGGRRHARWGLGSRS